MLARAVWISIAAFSLFAQPSYAQLRKPTPKEASSIQACAAATTYLRRSAAACSIWWRRHYQHQDRPGTNLGSADSGWSRRSGTILLNDNFKALRDALDDGQKAKLRDMHSARGSPISLRILCDKIQGSMAVPMSAACAAREAARRALLLKFFGGL